MMSISTDPWVWVSALITIGIYSVLFKDNPMYQFLESVFVGMAAGYLVVVNWFSFLKPTVSDEIAAKGNYSLIIPLILGLLVYTRYSKSVGWLSRYSMAFMMGVGSGYVLAKDFKPLFLTQAKATMLPLNSVDNILIVFGVVSSLMYFFFTVRRSGAFGLGTKFGRWVLMMAFGAAFGNTVMGRVSVTLGRFQYILTDWLGIVK
ncbi:MAG: hypothetical protein ACOX5Q_03685 [Bacillota bacterium]|jgi:hypothetical protein